MSDWEKPILFERALPAVPALDLHLLPESTRLWIGDLSARMQCPPDYFAACYFVQLGAVIGRKIMIRPKQQDDWTVCPNNYGVLVAPSGLLKTPAVEQAMKPIRRLEHKAREKYDSALTTWQAEAIVNEAKVKNLKKNLEQSIRKGGIDGEQIAAEIMALDRPPPLEHRYTTNDITIEKAAIVLNETGNNGLFFFRDEIIGYFAGFEKDGHEQDRAFLLEGHTGNGGPYRQDRVGRAEVIIQCVTLSLFGCTTPSGLQSYLRQALDETHNDGLIQRLQVSVYPDQPKTWRNVDRWPDTDAKNRVCDVFEKIDTAAVESFGAEELDDRGNHILRFSLDAQIIFDDFRTKLENWLLKAEAHPAFKSHLGKYRSFLPSLALELHLADVADGKCNPGPISEDAAARAVKLIKYFTGHATRIYDSLISKAEVAEAMLGSKIMARKLADPFTVRDVYRNEWIGLATKEEAERAIEGLEDRHWVRRESPPPNSKGGRRIERFQINPRLFEKK